MTLSRFAYRLLRPESPGALGILARGAGLAFLIQGAGAGLKYVSHVIFARWLGPDEYGLYAYAFTWCVFLAIVADLGMSAAALRLIPEYLAGEMFGRLRGVVRLARRIASLAGTVIAAVGTAVLLLVKGQGHATYALIIAFWLAPLLALLNVQREITRGLRRIVLAYVPAFLLHPVLIIVLGWLILRVSGRLASIPLLAATGVAALLVLLIQGRSLRWVLPSQLSDHSPHYMTSQWLRISLPLLLVTGSVVTLNQADIVIVGLLVGTREAGLYTAATKTASLVSLILMSVNAMAAPMIASLHARGETAALRSLVNQSTRLMFWPALVGASLLFLFSDQVLGLFGQQFLEGRPILRILIAGHLVNAVAGPVGYLMSLTGHQKESAVVFGSSAAVNIILNIVLVSFWGVIGAAVSTLTTMVLWNLWLYRLVRRRLGINPLAFWQSSTAE